MLSCRASCAPPVDLLCAFWAAPAGTTKEEAPTTDVSLSRNGNARRYASRSPLRLVRRTGRDVEMGRKNIVTAFSGTSRTAVDSPAALQVGPRREVGRNRPPSTSDSWGERSGGGNANHPRPRRVRCLPVVTLGMSRPPLAVPTRMPSKIYRTMRASTAVYYKLQSYLAFSHQSTQVLRSNQAWKPITNNRLQLIAEEPIWHLSSSLSSGGSQIFGDERRK